MGQIAHGADHIVVHLKMRLSELIHLLLHCDLLTSHLQTLTFWRRNHNDGPTLSRQTCPRTRTHPDISLARVFAQGIQFAHTHKTYAKTSAQRQSATDRLTFGATSLAMLNRHTSLCLLLLKVTMFPGPLCSLPMHILNLLTLLPPLTRLHNT